MKNLLKNILEYTCALFKEWILWVFLGLDFIGFIIRYLPMLNDKYSQIQIPNFVFWTLLIGGFFLSSFRVYLSAKDYGTHKMQQLKRDQDFFKELTNVLPKTGSINWLREYDFGGAFRFNWLGDIRNFIDLCKHPDFEFIDDELESLKLQLLKQCNDFLDAIQSGTESINKVEFVVMRIPPKLMHKNPEKFHSIRKQINVSARNVVETYDKLIRQSRRKL